MSLYNFHVGDCEEILNTLSNESFQLIYIDPPYNTGRVFGDFHDKFDSPEHYINFLENKLKLMHAKLKNSGTFVCHVDPIMSHHLKVALDGIFGFKNFRNEIIWRTTAMTKPTKKLRRMHDSILVYSKTNKQLFNPIYEPYSKEYLATMKSDERGLYSTSPAKNNNPDSIPRPNLRYEWNGHTNQWWVSKEKMQEFHDDNRLHYSKSGVPRIKRYASESKGVLIGDVWTDISSLQKKEKLGYDTQKPVELLKRFVTMYTNKGDFVLDCFAGSGTTGRASIELSRFPVLIDINNKSKTIFENSL